MEVNIMEAVMVGVAAGAAGAGGLGWFMTRKVLERIERDFIPKSLCDLKHIVSDEKHSNLLILIKNLDKKMCERMEEHQQQLGLLIKMLKASND